MLSSVIVLVKIICLLIAIAFYTLAERKIMGAIHRRRGPNVTGVWGLIQPIADGVKLVVKNVRIIRSASQIIFIAAPLVVFALSLTNWIVIAVL